MRNLVVNDKDSKNNSPQRVKILDILAGLLINFTYFTLGIIFLFVITKYCGTENLTNKLLAAFLLSYFAITGLCVNTLILFGKIFIKKQ